MNAKIRHLAIGLIVCYIALFVQLNVLQVGKEEALTTDPRNNRQTIRDFNRPRGPIVTADGVVVARNVPVTDPDDEFVYQREYPTGTLFANVTVGVLMTVVPPAPDVAEPMLTTVFDPDAPPVPRFTVDVSVLSSCLSFDSLNPSDHPKTFVNPNRFVMS